MAGWGRGCLRAPRGPARERSRRRGRRSTRRNASPCFAPPSGRGAFLSWSRAPPAGWPRRILDAALVSAPAHVFCAMRAPRRARRGQPPPPRARGRWRPASAARGSPTPRAVTGGGSLHLKDFILLGRGDRLRPAGRGAGREQPGARGPGAPRPRGAGLCGLFFVSETGPAPRLGLPAGGGGAPRLPRSRRRSSLRLRNRLPHGRRTKWQGAGAARAGRSPPRASTRLSATKSGWRRSPRSAAHLAAGQNARGPWAGAEVPSGRAPPLLARGGAGSRRPNRAAPILSSSSSPGRARGRAGGGKHF
jgi:hypothetical protein